MAWFKPKSKPVEERSAIDPYEPSIHHAPVAADVGTGRPYPGSGAAALTSAAETCARWWSGALGSATVENDPHGAVTSEMLAQIGRALIRSGEAAYLIDVSAGRVRLLPAATFWLEGPPDPMRWRYRLTLSGPSGSATVTASPEAVVHLKWAELPAAPWRGAGPLTLARHGARRAWAAETRVGDVASIGVGSGIILSTELADQDDSLREWLDDYADYYRSNDGGPFVTSRKFEVTDARGGIAPQPADIENNRQALAALAACCGIPPVLISAEPTAAAGQREAYRQFVHASVAPMAETLAAELRRKLDAPSLTLAFTELRAADIAGRARAFRSLTDAGYPPHLAAEACGLPAVPDTAPDSAE